MGPTVSDFGMRWSNRTALSNLSYTRVPLSNYPSFDRG